jgi:hypothetical protein
MSLGGDSYDFGLEAKNVPRFASRVASKPLTVETPSLSPTLRKTRISSVPHAPGSPKRGNASPPPAGQEYKICRICEDDVLGSQLSEHSKYCATINHPEMLHLSSEDQLLAIGGTSCYCSIVTLVRCLCKGNSQAKAARTGTPLLWMSFIRL